MLMAATWRDRLREAFERSGLSAREVSIRAGQSPNYLPSILKAGQSPSIDKFIRLADVLNVSITWLVLGTELGPEQERFLRAYSKLSPKQRQAILDLADPDDDQEAP